ncbi:sugar ABC transporter substrate-binding protein [Nocardioides sp. YIM 152315]|uniref:sugar ABC transporter substrate-binding protein n=1 Tax=Nocardioides sp. YIM 152315 TaxID=3031760 RepID=UPI0023D9ACAE|nr:sugar ABC transporter substrate-binding protein [Nocardioides sp. YIM 152315]
MTTPEKAREQVVSSLKGKKIAYVPIGQQFDITSLWRSRLERAFEPMGVEFSAPDAAFDTQRMTQILDSLINDKVDMIILQNPDVGVLSEQIARAQQEGIYVIAVNELGNQSPDAYVGADHVTMAADLADRMVSDCQAAGKNKIAIIDGNGTDGTSIATNEGWDPVFEEAGMDVVSTQHSRYDPAVANTIASTVLQKNPDLCGFAVNWDVTAVGVGEAIDAAGLKGKVGVYNIDASGTWCDALDKGIVTAGAAYDAAGIGTAAAMFAQQLFLLGNAPGTSHTVSFVPYTIVDESNVGTTSTACYGKS